MIRRMLEVMICSIWQTSVKFFIRYSPQSERDSLQLLQNFASKTGLPMPIAVESRR